MVHVTDRVEPDPQRHRRYEELYHAYVQTYEGLSSGGAFNSLARIQAESCTVWQVKRMPIARPQGPIRQQLFRLS